MKKLYQIAFLLVTSIAIAQGEFFNAVEFKSVGPTIMSGRIVDINVNPNNTNEFYAAYASGGLWYTNNNGNSFKPVLDTAPTQNCGAIAVDWVSGMLWVGTGEVNASRSSYSGIGLLKSSDKGKTWEHIGLKDSHHISRILVNPKNSNEISVGVIGHLYTKNEERGVFKTTDGGITWKKTLFVDNESGVIDLVTAPNNYSIQYASVWQKDRKAWNFSGNGKSSGIYKSTDGGVTWKCISVTNGFPFNDGVGRIGLAAFDENVIYAVVDNQNKRPAEANTKSALNEMFSVPGEEFLKISDKEINSVLKNHGFREKFRAQNVKNWISDQNMKPSEALHKLQDANKALFETQVIGCEVYKSDDGGKNWVKTNSKYIDDMYYTYGYYFANIAVDAKNSNRVYIGGVPLLFSEDGGKTFTSIDKENVHADHHSIWINPNDSNHVINGNDGGVNITYDNGANWFKCNNQAVGQFYAINVDEQEPYNVYGGLQDNGVWVGPGDYHHDLAWQQEGKYPYEQLLGGDGMQVQIDKRNPNIVFTGFQFGNYYKIDRKKDKRVPITPKAKKEEKPYRFNWQTPILLSSHNQDILYLGSNFLHRSMNQGETWQIISQDLTQGPKEGNVAYGTITTIAESALQFGLLYTGSDDGFVYVSKDGGVSWNKISNNLPQNLWVSRVVPSSFKKERVYAALNGYRNDEFTAMVYVSEDYGITWKSIASNLPQSPVNVILEDNKNENILYVGTDNGLFVSLNKGTTWQDFSNGMPNVAVHDLVIQKKVNDLIVGTHGRSVYKTNLEKVQQLNNETLNKELVLFEVSSVKKNENWGKNWSTWSKPYEPNVEIWFYVNSNEKINVRIENPLGKIIFNQEVQANKGLNKIVYNLSITKQIAEIWMKKSKELKLSEAKNGLIYLPASKNKVIISKEKVILEKEFEVTEDKKKP